MKKRCIEADNTRQVLINDYSNMQHEKPIRGHETDYVTVWYHKLIRLSQNTYILLSLLTLARLQSHKEVEHYYTRSTKYIQLIGNCMILY